VEERTIGARGERRRSKLEESIEAELLSASYRPVFYEPMTLHYSGLNYTPDFVCVSAHAPRLAVEVKPNRRIAASEIRLEFLVVTSPLWLVADLFVLAFDWQTWLCCNAHGVWRTCHLSADEGIVVEDEVANGAPWMNYLE